MAKQVNNLATDAPNAEGTSERRFLIATYSVLALVVIGISIVVISQVLRDTWVRDNRYTIIQQLDQADAANESKKLEMAIEQYRSVCVLIGDHHIDDPILGDRVRKAREQVLQYDNAAIESKRMRDAAELAAAKAQEELALIDPKNISDPFTVQVFIGAKQDYDKYGWPPDLLNATIKSQILFERDYSTPNLWATDELLSRFEEEWRANRIKEGLPPEKRKDEIK